MIGRSGQNGGGKGGHDYRLNWTDMTGGARFGGYSIRLDSSNTAHPLKVFFEGKPLLRDHGVFVGYQAFKTVEDAKGWVEKRIRSVSPIKEGDTVNPFVPPVAPHRGSTCPRCGHPTRPPAPPK